MMVLFIEGTKVMDGKIDVSQWDTYYQFGTLSIRDMVELEIDPRVVGGWFEEEERAFLVALFSRKPMPLVTTQAVKPFAVKRGPKKRRVQRLCVAGVEMVSVLRNPNWCVDFATMEVTTDSSRETILSVRDFYTTVSVLRMQRKFPEWERNLDVLQCIYSGARFPWCELHYTYPYFPSEDES